MFHISQLYNIPIIQTPSHALSIPCRQRIYIVWILLKPQSMITIWYSKKLKRVTKLIVRFTPVLIIQILGNCRKTNIVTGERTLAGTNKYKLTIKCFDPKYHKANALAGSLKEFWKDTKWMWFFVNWLLNILYVVY